MKYGAWVVIVCALVGWAAGAGPLVEALRPEIGLSMDGQGILRVRCGVTPVGPAGFTGQANLHWSLWPEIGSWRIVTTFSELLALKDGEERVLSDNRIRFAPGNYTLAFGDPCEGETVASFSVAHDSSGRPVLVAPARFLGSPSLYAVPTAEEPSWEAIPEARRAAAWARAALAEDLAICARKIEVAEVVAREFADSSLGVREPGMMYAQAITPGHVVRLAWQERAFEYRVAGEHMARVADVPTGRVPDDVWVVNVFAYHAGVDLLLHGELACSTDAVLPLARWAPLTASPLEAALLLLVTHGLAPWEVAAGYSSEFPLAGVSLESLRIDDGVLTVVFADPEHRTSGGACRTGILRAQIEKTALQFPEVREVRILPPEALQP
ncbi:MAG TPA: hypothetical protein ENN53_03465 [Candidatus Acetothermia bacterium]|nr:hypothetical protein [Candidatus Acetothermia bacterium]